jgi:hypothetical protein
MTRKVAAYVMAAGKHVELWTNVQAILCIYLYIYLVLEA